MYLTVTIDTEEDNWGEYQRSSYSVQNVKQIPRLQEVFASRGIRPTYLVSYPVAVDSDAIEILGRYRDRDQCEIGTHLHPWNTPPMEEERTVHNSFASNLSSSLQYRKIKTLHDTITRNFGAAPRCYRSGRWGFSEDVAKNLIRLEYAVDTSFYPTWDWRSMGGPDYTRCTPEPFIYQMRRSEKSPGGSLLEVPATVDFVQNRRHVAGSAYWGIKRYVPASDKVLAALNKLGILSLVCLSPELNHAWQMISLATRLFERGTRVVNMFFHSPSLLAKCSPFVTTDADVREFTDRIDQFLAFAQSAGLTSVTMSELTPEKIGALRVKVLASA